MPVVVGVFVFRLPEAGSIQRRATPPNIDTAMLADLCRQGNDTSETQQLCLSDSIDSAEQQWRLSPESKNDFWTGSEVSSRRNSYVFVGALALLALAILAGAMLATRPRAP